MIIRPWTGFRLAEAWPGAIALGLAALVLLPLLTLLWLGRPGEGGLLAGSVRHVLPYALRDTLLLSAGVAIVTIITGTTMAALAAFAAFPGRKLMAVMAVLPMAFPTYLQSYIMVEIKGHADGLSSASPLAWLWHGFALIMPEPRSMPGAIFVFSLVLYPYVYIAARVAFASQGQSLFNAARSMGRRPVQAFLSVSLPLAASPILAGAMLAIMETLNDIGASEYLGVRTLAFTIYTTWLGRDDLAGAAQLSIGLVAMVMFLSFLAQHVSRRSAQAGAVRSTRPQATIETSRGWGLIFCLMGFAPIVAGFVLPAVFLVEQAVRRGLPPEAMGQLAHAAAGSFSVSAMAALATMMAATLLLLPYRLRNTAFSRAAGRVASYGYAIPGAVLALATFIPAGAFDNWLDAHMKQAFGISTGLLLSGTVLLLVYAYGVRLLSVAYGILKSGLDRVPTSLDMAARTLGRGPVATFIRVPLRLSLPAVLGGLLLVFVDGVKELPLTLILRPLGFETLATSLYDSASRGEFEAGALQALLMVALGVIAAFVGLRSTFRAVGTGE